MNDNLLEIDKIQMTYEGKPLLGGISFSISEGETICLLGPSGSGKSTLLRIIAGLEIPTAGQVRWKGQDLVSVPPHLRHFGLVFQDYALFPHMDVAANITFGLKMQNMTEVEKAQRLTSILQTVNLVGFAKRQVTDLSGGEQQRVALARALAPNPRLLMFDEPLGALDRNLREQLIGELRRILKERGIPAIYVTHDQDEAFTLADRVLLLHAGIILRNGTPEEIWNDPGSLWAAKFLDAGNTIIGTIVTNTKPYIVKTPAGIFNLNCRHTHIKGEKIAILVGRFGVHQAEKGEIQGLVVDVIFKEIGFKVTLDNGLVFYLPESPKVGERITLSNKMIKVKCLIN